MELTPQQVAWLHTRGGRTAKSIHIQDGKLYVFMYSPTSLTGLELVPVGDVIPYEKQGKRTQSHALKPLPIIKSEPNNHYEKQTHCKVCGGRRFRDHKRKCDYFDHKATCRYAHH